MKLINPTFPIDFHSSKHKHKGEGEGGGEGGGEAGGDGERGGKREGMSVQYIYTLTLLTLPSKRVRKSSHIRIDEG